MSGTQKDALAYPYLYHIGPDSPLGPLDTIIIHVGKNGLPTEKGVMLVQTIATIFETLHIKLPDNILLWSELLAL